MYITNIIRTEVIDMDSKKINKRLNMAGAAATAVYFVAAGKGPFNKYRFKEQHEELSKYIDTNYPGCAYSTITAHGKGYSAAVLKLGAPIKFIYFSKGTDGHYIFTELDEKMK